MKLIYKTILSVRYKGYLKILLYYTFQNEHKHKTENEDLYSEDTLSEIPGIIGVLKVDFYIFSIYLRTYTFFFFAKH